MANHLRNQHIRAQQPQQNIRKQTSMEKFQHMFSSQMQRIRSSPKMMIGTILIVLLIIAIIVVALHYFRVITLPIISIPQVKEVAPASHLQYFFF